MRSNEKIPNQVKKRIASSKDAPMWLASPVLVVEVGAALVRETDVMVLVVVLVVTVFVVELSADVEEKEEVEEVEEVEETDVIDAVGREVCV